MTKTICILTSQGTEESVGRLLRSLDPQTCLVLRDPNPTVDKLATVLGFETFFFVGQIPNIVDEIVVIGEPTDGLPHGIPVRVWGPKVPATNAVPNAVPKEVGTLHKSNSFQFVDQGDSDGFLRDCCKTFAGDQDVFEESQTTSKFMQIMLIEAKKCSYRERKEEFKRNLRREVLIGTKKQTSMCKASTKKGKAPCGNKALDGSDYCGIPSHKKLGQPVRQVSQTPQT